MSREIKFRCWDKYNKEMLDVEDLHWDDCTREFSIRTTMYSDYFDIEDMILMQYTGLKDKNGKEIYEGDIIKVIYKDEIEIYSVIYDESFCCFRMVTVKDFPNDNFLDFADEERDLYEVIGNIYENTELLKGEQS